MAQSYYLNQCWYIVNWTLRIKLQWNFNWNSYICFQENAFEKVVCKMAANLSRPQCVNSQSTVGLSTPKLPYPKEFLVMDEAETLSLLARELCIQISWCLICIFYLNEKDQDIFADMRVEILCHVKYNIIVTCMLIRENQTKWTAVTYKMKWNLFIL